MKPDRRVLLGQLSGDGTRCGDEAELWSSGRVRLGLAWWVGADRPDLLPLRSIGRRGHAALFGRSGRVVLRNSVKRP
jgi:hypothetical protein